MKILSWITTIIFIIPFGLSFLVFHVAQVITLNIFGYQAHKKTMDYLQAAILATLLLSGTTFRIRRSQKNLPRNRPLIIISNHQSIFDITFIIWAMRRHHPKFVAKKELGKGIPSVSYHLNYGGNVLIDRKDKIQSLRVIGELGEYIEKYTRSAVIYPEGSRSKTGILKEFKVAGVAKLLEKSPSALVVPIAIENSWKLVRYNFKPFPFGTACKLTVLEAIEPQGLSPQEILNLAEERIREQLNQPKPIETIKK